VNQKTNLKADFFQRKIKRVHLLCSGVGAYVMGIANPKVDQKRPNQLFEKVTPKAGSSSSL
jgi:hypothetical protein